MPNVMDKLDAYAQRIVSELIIAIRESKKAEEDFGRRALVADPDLTAMKKEIEILCTPFLEQLQKHNAKFNDWFEKKLQQP